MSKRVQLISPPLDSWYTTGQIKEFVSVPIGLCIISKRLRDAGAEVSIFDGKDISLDETLANVEGDMIGVTDMYSNHGNSLSILKRAKDIGAVTIIGGPNVNYLAERNLRNHEFIDFAVMGDGEDTLQQLYSGNNLETIPNLVYRTNGKVIKNRPENASLTTLFDFEDIINIPDDITRHVASLSSIRGCVKAEEYGRCSFCSISHELKLMDPDLVWRQIRLLKEKYGITSFLETGDSFMVGTYPNEILEKRPDDLDGIYFGRIYASPDQIDEHSAEILRKLNVKCVFLGIESFNDNVLCEAGKNYSRRDIESAIDLLESKGMFFHVPFMYGLSGETPNTMEETFRFAKKMVSEYPSVKIVTSVAIPFPGTELFENIKNHEIAKNEYNGNRRDMDGDDEFDYQLLVRQQLKRFTKVSYDHAISMVRKTRGLVTNEENVTSYDINK